MPTNRCAASRLAIVAAFAVCGQDCRPPIVSQLTSDGSNLVHAWLIANAQKKEALPRHTAVCCENAPFSAIKESHIMYRPTLQRIPLSEVFHITGFLPAPEVEAVMVCD